MAQRYEIINHIKQEYWVNNAPVLLSAHALVKDTVADTVCVQCKFQNISQNSISALYVYIDCIGADSNAVKGVEQYVYLDAKADLGDFFGDSELIVLPNKTTRQFCIFLEKIVFADGTIWNLDEKCSFSPISAPLLLSTLGHLEEQYLRTAPSILHANLPEKHENYWRCGCGQINLIQTQECLKCKHNLPEQLASIDKNVLDKQLAEYAAHKLEQERIEAERIQLAEEKEQERIEQEKEERSKRAKKRAKLAIAIIAICFLFGVLVAVSIYYIEHHFIPSRQYSDAVARMNEEDFDEAIAIFTSLNDYKDSIDMIDKCLFELGKNELADSGSEPNMRARYDAAMVYFELIDKDNEVLLLDVKETIYSYATSHELKDDQSGLYKLILSSPFLFGYKDASELVADYDYRLALRLYENNNFINAYGIFDKIYDYRDVSELMENCVRNGYQMEIERYRSGENTLFFDNNMFDGLDDIDKYRLLARARTAAANSFLPDSVTAELFELYWKLRDIGDFEDAETIRDSEKFTAALLSYGSAWRDGEYSFSYYITPVTNTASAFAYLQNTSDYYSSNTYRIRSAIFQTGSDSRGWQNVFRFTFIDKTTMELYDYSDGRTYTMTSGYDW